MKKTILYLFVIFISTYSAPKINPVSPYVNRGVSMHLQMAYNPLIIEYNYKRNAFENQYVGYANDIYLTQKKLVRDGYVAIGSKDEKKELFASIMMFPWRFQAQYKANVFKSEKNNLFQNISISPFGGIAIAKYIYNSITDHIFLDQNNGYVQLYSGVSLGTRKKIIDDFSYIEVFTAPQISLAYYYGLGGGEDYNPVGELDPDNWEKGKSFSQTKYDFTAPIGLGFKRRWFFVKGGIVMSTTLNKEKGTYRNGKLTINSHNLPQIPFFMEIGCHFRKFKELEKENSNLSEI